MSEQNRDMSTSQKSPTTPRSTTETQIAARSDPVMSSQSERSRIQRRNRERIHTTDSDQHRSRSPRTRAEADSTSVDDDSETRARVRNVRSRALGINIDPNLGAVTRNQYSGRVTYVPALSEYQPVAAIDTSSQARGQNRLRRQPNRNRVTSSTITTHRNSTPVSSELSDVTTVTPRTSAPDTITTSTATSSVLTQNDSSTVSQSGSSARHSVTGHERRGGSRRLVVAQNDTHNAIPVGNNDDNRRPVPNTGTLTPRNPSRQRRSGNRRGIIPRVEVLRQPDTVTTSTATSSVLTQNDNSTVSQSSSSARIVVAETETRNAMPVRNNDVNRRPDPTTRASTSRNASRRRQRATRSLGLIPRVETFRQPGSDVTRSVIHVRVMPRRDLRNAIPGLSSYANEPSSSETGSPIPLVNNNRLNLRRRSIRTSAQRSTPAEVPSATDEDADADSESEVPSTSRGSQVDLGSSVDNPIVIVNDSTPDSSQTEGDWWQVGRFMTDLDLDSGDDRDYDPDGDESPSSDDEFLYQYTNEDVRRFTVSDTDSGHSCTICLDDLCIGEEAGHLPCFHKFHMPCITRWMMRSNTCPLCRTRVPLRHTAGIP